MKSSSHRNSRSPHYLHVLTIFAVIIFPTLPVAGAEREGEPIRYHSQGTLTNTEDNGCEISGKGYALDTDAIILNAEERPVSLETFSLPVSVEYEYSYQKTGPNRMSPVVVSIQEIEN